MAKKKKRKNGMNENQQAIMRALSEGHVLVGSDMTPKWQKRWPGCPSLNNPDVSALFRANLIECANNYTRIVVSVWGRVVLQSMDKGK